MSCKIVTRAISSSWIVMRDTAVAAAAAAATAAAAMMTRAAVARMSQQASQLQQAQAARLAVVALWLALLRPTPTCCLMSCVQHARSSSCGLSQAQSRWVWLGEV
jgi:hypothetical protein